MPRAPRLLAAIGVLAASGLAVSACAPVHAGAAGTVGNTRISVTEVKAGVDTMLQDKGTQASASSNSDLQRSVLDRMIKDKLLADAAKLKGVTVSEGDVQTQLTQAVQQTGGKDQLNAAAAQQGIAAADLHDYIYYQLLQQELGKALIKDASIQTAHLAVIALNDAKTADQVLAEVKADPSKFGDIAKQKSLDTNTRANGGDIGDIPIDGLPEPLKTDITSKPIGSVFEEQIQGGYYVILLKARGTTALSDIQGSQAAQQAEQTALNTYLSTVSKQEGVSVSPRYGSWDAGKLTVTPGGGALSSPEASSPASPASPASGG